MASKIELYREVLEIEPNSKVFFPLARQLVEEGRADEAAVILSRGITVHPDHLEAKFLLIEILSRQGREAEADAVFADVGSLLARYPSVWLLWSKVASDRAKDPSLALLFLAHYFQNASLTWTEVMERGLKSLGATAEPASSEESLGRTVTEPPRGASVLPEADAALAAAVSAPSLIAQRVDREVPGAPPLRGAREVMELSELLEAPGELTEKGRTKPGRGREAEVRTRTMAALLAEQGDSAGALDIYTELLATASPGPEREELLGCIAALTPSAGTAPTPPPLEEPAGPQAAHAPDVTDVADAPKPKGANKLVNLLEALAGRLEARAEA